MKCVGTVASVGVVGFDVGVLSFIWSVLGVAHDVSIFKTGFAGRSGEESIFTWVKCFFLS